MPTVPRKTDSVSSTGVPNVRVSTQTPVGAFGGGQKVTQALSGLNQTMSKIFADAKRQADDAMVDKEYANLLAKRNQFSASVNTRVGEQSFGLPEELQSEWGKWTEESNSGLKNRYQRESFNQKAMSVYNSLDSQVQNHVASESFKFSVQQKESAIKNELKYAVENFNDRNVSESSREKIMSMVNESSWLTPEEKKETEREHLSSMNIGIIGQLVDSGQTDAAKQYFFENAAEIDQTNLNERDLNKYIETYNSEKELKVSEQRNNNSKVFNESFVNAPISEQIEELRVGTKVGKYDSKWAEKRKLEILSAKGIDSEHVLEYEADIINFIADSKGAYRYDKTAKEDKGEFLKSSKEYLRTIQDIDMKISEGVAEGLLNRPQAIRLRKSLYSGRPTSEATSSVGGEDKWPWQGYDLKNATDSFKKLLNTGQVAQATREFFYQTDGVEGLDDAAKKDIAYKIIQKMQNQGRARMFQDVDNKIEGKGALPPGVTEEDILFTMKNNNMSREEVLERIK